MGKVQAIQEAIRRKVQKLPAKEQARVLDFVESLGLRRARQRRSPPIYDYSAILMKRKRLKKVSLSKIAAIVHEVRNGHDPALSL